MEGMGFIDTTKLEGFELIRYYNELYAQYKEASDKAEELKGQLAAVKPRLLESMLQNGMQTARAGGLTTYIHRQLWAGTDEMFSTQVACDKLKDMGLGDYVKEGYSTQSLSAYVREQAKLAGAEFPDDPLKAHEAEAKWIEDFIKESSGVLKVDEKIDLRTRRG